MQIPDPFDSSGCFETCRVREGKVLHLREHLERLRGSLKRLGLSPLEERGIAREMSRAAKEVREGSVRIAVRREGEPRVLFYQSRGVPYSKDQRSRGLSMTTVAARQPSVEAIPAQAKRSQRLDGLLAREEAPGAPEVLRLGPHGYLTEGTVSNLFIVKERRVVTPPLWLGVLEGITRARVIERAGRFRIPVLEIPITRHELFNADEAFLTNVLMGILPIREVDGRRIGSQVPGPMTRRLAKILGEG